MHKDEPWCLQSSSLWWQQQPTTHQNHSSMQNRKITSGRDLQTVLSGSQTAVGMQPAGLWRTVWKLHFHVRLHLHPNWCLSTPSSDTWKALPDLSRYCCRHQTILLWPTLFLKQKGGGSCSIPPAWPHPHVPSKRQMHQILMSDLNCDSKNAAVSNLKKLPHK